MSEDDAWFAAWRRRELSRVVKSGTAYLDYTGSALFPESLIRWDAARLTEQLVGNPHSEHDPSRASSASIAEARSTILSFVNASPDEYVVVLTANSSGACRLVGESFPFGSGSKFLAAADNHNSVNGIREYACRAGASIGTVGLDVELRLVGAEQALMQKPVSPSLFAFPAQSNFSGVRHPLELVRTAQLNSWRVLLDAAAFLPTSELDLEAVPADFVALSLYKITGYPTGVGALVARREALAQLKRPWFAGGTVHWVSLEHRSHLLLDGVEAFEDGTPSFLSAAAVAPALEAVRSAGRERLAMHLQDLTKRLLQGLLCLRHGNGAPMVVVHGPTGSNARGATVALNLCDRDGATIPYWEVEQAACKAGLAVRGGCFCNPGCAEAAFRFPERDTRDCLSALGGDFTIPRFSACLGGGTVGAIRVSLGLGSIAEDVERFLRFVALFHRRLAS